MASDCLVTVVMALYRPNIKWLTEELLSIQQQTFQNFQVYVWNDDPDDTYDYHQLFLQYLKGISFKIFHGLHNMGSNKVFEKLTSLTTTPYIVYCDQDDIWLSGKLSSLLHQITDSHASLVFSDMYVIDETSTVLADSITKVRPRQKIYSGKALEEHLLAKNFVTGCTMMMRTDIAQKAIPFPDFCFHDWWLAAFALLSGHIDVVRQPLMKYRISEENQSKPLAGIFSKKDYYDKYILHYRRFLELLAASFPDDKRLQPYLSWSEARTKYFFKRCWKDAVSLWKYKSWAPSTIKFELLLPFIPNFVFSWFLRKIQSN